MKKTEATDSFVLDTSALLTLRNDEEGADAVDHSPRSGAHVYVSFMSFMEDRYRLWKNAGRAESEEFSKHLDLLPVRRMNNTEPIFQRAIETKATNSLSVCDSWIVATAVSTDSILVYRDPQFEQVGAIVKLKTLPYKPLMKEKGCGSSGTTPQMGRESRTNVDFHARSICWNPIDSTVS